MQGSASLLYSDPLLSSLTNNATLFTGIHCLKDGSVLVLSESFVMHISLASSPANATLFHQSFTPDEDDWFAWKLSADESRLITSVQVDASDKHHLFLYDLSDLSS
jgi:hypothetical protein